MGYTTNFTGEFTLDKPLTAEHLDKLINFSEDRHGGSVPSYYCQWMPNSDGTAIEWNGGEKFYNYVEWIQYLIEHFLAPWGYVLNGTVEWDGEDRGDLGKIEITNNTVKVLTGKVTYE